jgi:hypothetical protein
MRRRMDGVHDFHRNAVEAGADGVQNPALFH